MSMTSSIAREYLDTIDRIRYSKFKNKRDLRWLEGQRALLHRQLTELTGKRVTVALTRRLAASSR